MKDLGEMLKLLGIVFIICMLPIIGMVLGMFIFPLMVMDRNKNVDSSGGDININDIIDKI